MKKNAKLSGKKSASFIAILFGLFLLYFLVTNLRATAFFQKKDRLNVVVGEDTIAYYSIGLTDNVNYFIPFFSDLEVVVPGGYGYYRLGALPKLASLEKNPDLFKKTYSLISSSMVDYYFYPSTSSDKMEVFFGKEKSNFSLPTLSVIFFGKSNANILDRFYVYLQFLGKTKSQFKAINSLATNKQGNRTTFSQEDFFEILQGIFYKRTYRSEERNVQIMYTSSYKTAQQLGQILEGEGIRVADLTQSNSSKDKCRIVEESEKPSKTASSLSQFFACDLINSDTGAYDIIFELGKAEKEWEIE